VLLVATYFVISVDYRHNANLLCSTVLLTCAKSQSWR